MTNQKLHPGYEIVDRVDKLCRGLVAQHDPYLKGQPEMSREASKALRRELKKIWKECRMGIEKLRELGR